MNEKRRLPVWLKMKRAGSENYLSVKELVTLNNLHTICTSGNCPNKGECWNAGTATLMILGEICTRSCKFCGTITGKPLPPDPEEPLKVADTIRLLKLKHCVITSVDRDDLPDGGSSHWAEVINRVKRMNPAVTIEVLIPDFRGITSHIDKIINAWPDVISHNIETVRRLTPRIRSVARYDVSLKVIRHIASHGCIAKSGLMLGLGETKQEVIETMEDLRAAGCKVITIGQYLAPSLTHMPVVDYIEPSKFDEYRSRGLAMGFDFVESGPLVRSSYHAGEHVKNLPLNIIDLGLTEYGEAREFQENIFNRKVTAKASVSMEVPEGINSHSDPDYLILVEHPHVYTLGKSGSMENLLLDYIQLQAGKASFYHTDRGGDITYHGPGQLVGYPILDLERAGYGIREYIWRLEESVIQCLASYGIIGEHKEGATGVWLDTNIPGRERKICAIGVKVSRAITMHGFALNINTDLTYFNHINPCGYRDKGVTSMEKETGRRIDMDEVKQKLVNCLRSTVYNVHSKENS